MSTADAVWLDCSAGVAGDMLLGALLDAGADLAKVRSAVRAVAPVLDVTVETTARHGITASKATVVDTSTGEAADAVESRTSSEVETHHHDHHHHHHHDHDHDHDHGHGHGHGHDHDHGHHDHGHGHHEGLDGHGEGHGRPWSEVRRLVEAAGLSDSVTRRALGAFARLAEAEAAVHGTTPDEVHFHEVGSLDAIGDVVGCVTALDDLGVESFTCSVVTLGSGDQTVGQHGRIPIPGPAVTHLARAAGMVTTGGPVTMEMTTPTGAALLAEYATGYGPMPTMVIDRVGVGAGTRDPHRLANVVRVVLGRSAETRTDTAIPAEDAFVLECNIDDLDPRLWPGVLQDLIDAGAADAWLTPIQMKKGRPAHQLSVLSDGGHRDALLEMVVTATTTIGVREVPVTKYVLDRSVEQVQVDGVTVRVKVARLRERVVNVQPEYEDVAALAAQLGIPAKTAMARSVAAAAELN